MMEQYNIAKNLTDQKLHALEGEILSIRQKSQQLTERHSKLLDRQRDMTQQNGGSLAKGSDKMHLNVGGTEMYALRETLTLIKGSRLEVLFSGRWENTLLRDEKGRIFLDLDACYFKKIMEYLYSMKRNKDGSQENLPDWPTFHDRDDQKIFDLYVDFFGLRKVGEECTHPSKISPNSDKNSNNNDNEEGENESCQDLLDAFKKEREELDLVKKNLDDIEKKLGEEEEEDIVSFFTTPHTHTDTKEKKLEYDTDDTMSFTTITSEIDIVVPPISQVSDDDTKSLVLNLWIDGEVVSVKRSTLCMCKGSRLTENFNDAAWMKKHSFKNDDGLKVVLIEHSSVFKTIINQLRLRCMKIGVDELPNIKMDDAGLVENVVSELFAGEEEFILGAKSKLESLILTSRSENNQIISWLGEVNRRSEPKLLYRASRDGWTTQSFHSKCDSKKNTVVIAKTKEGYVFGGYSDQSWEVDYEKYKNSTSCFLFSLKCNAGLPPTKMKLKSGNECNAVYAGCDYGPSFGSGCDIQIGIDGNMTYGYTNLNHNYEIPSDGSNTFLSGKTGYNEDDYFEVAEVEVFEV